MFTPEKSRVIEGKLENCPGAARLTSVTLLRSMPAADNPTGAPLYIAGHEGTGLANNTDGILILAAVPDNGSSLLLLGLAFGSIGCAMTFPALSRRS